PQEFENKMLIGVTQNAGAKESNTFAYHPVRRSGAFHELAQQIRGGAPGAWNLKFAAGALRSLHSWR
ncbi:MAG TPA: hypothetical protein VMD92_10410, partial [Acidobacteriaceae bacterium]|nr:hypothetical protein [Acidobacteriaceae bacterium]